MNIVEIKAEQLRSELSILLNNDEIGFTTSCTDFGVSCYLTFNGFKIRVSDHEATNVVRVQNEIMFNFNKSIEQMTSTIEQIIFPERFDFIPCVAGQKPTHIKNGKPCQIVRK